jgi:hypothetical protein
MWAQISLQEAKKKLCKSEHLDFELEGQKHSDHSIRHANHTWKLTKIIQI